jgi:peptidoglycan hydrolase-like protein with peptidoglycan-binding domain
MRRIAARPALLVTGLALMLTSCGGGATPTTTTTSPPSTTIDVVTTTTTINPTTTTTETTLPPNPPLVEEGDDNETVAAFQFLLNCNGYGDLTVDGNYGPATLAAVEAAQEDLGRTVNGAPDEETLAELSRSCAESRQLEGDEAVTLVGNAAPGDPEVLEASLLSGTTLKITFTQGNGLEVTVTGADGNEVTPQDPTTWAIDATQDYAIAIGSPVDPVTFTVTVEFTVGEREVGDWILATDGLIYKETKLALGSDAQTVIDKVFDYLDHGVRGAYDEFDTGWYAVTDPADMGLRGIFIEGFALLFFGPDPNNPDRPETFQRFRFVGPGLDADGEARPEDYATTAEGITVGDTLADLKAAYGSEVTAGSNDAEYWYRLVYSTGDLCFYFDTEDEPTDYAPITEISSECRTN